jgi:hypothetical protein
MVGGPSQPVPELEAAVKLPAPEWPAMPLAYLGLAYGLMGRRADAFEILAEIERPTLLGPPAPHEFPAVAVRILAALRTSF